MKETHIIIPESVLKIHPAQN